MRKGHLLFLFPGPIYRPNLPDFHDRFKGLSAYYSGHILSWTTRPAYRSTQIADFTFHGLLQKGGAIQTKLRLIAFFIRQARQLHRQQRFEAIICYEPTFTGLIGAFLKWILRCPLVIEVNNSNMKEALFLSDANRPRRGVKLGFYRLFSRLSLSQADTIKLLTAEQETYYRARFRRQRIVCFHDFVATHYFTPQPATGDPVLLFVGFPFHLKGVDLLIQAFSRVTDKYPKARLKLIGHRLEADARQAGLTLPARITFSKGLFYDQIRTEFEQCYALILPSRTEGMGRVLIEAMACGKPVIGAAVGGIPNIIEDGHHGFLFPKEDIEALTHRLDQLLGDTALAEAMGAKGRQRVEAQFSSRHYCQCFHQMIN